MPTKGNDGCFDRIDKLREAKRCKEELQWESYCLENRRHDWPNVKRRLKGILAKISSEQCPEIEILLSEPSLHLLLYLIVHRQMDFFEIRSE